MIVIMIEICDQIQKSVLDASGFLDIDPIYK